MISANSFSFWASVIFLSSSFHRLPNDVRSQAFEQWRRIDCPFVCNPHEKCNAVEHQVRRLAFKHNQLHFAEARPSRKPLQYSPRVHAVKCGIGFVGVRAQAARPDSMCDLAV